MKNDDTGLLFQKVCLNATDLERYRLWTQFFLQVNSCNDFGLCVDAIEVDAIIQDNGTQEQLQKIIYREHNVWEILEKSLLIGGYIVYK